MKMISRIKGVEGRGEDHDGAKGLAQFMRCHGCQTELRFSPAQGGSVLPEEFIHKKARQSGWLPKKNGRHLCPDCQKDEDMTNDTGPREMTPKDRRTIFRALDECYDEVNGRYCDDFTDNSVAKKLGVPRKWVEDIRVEAFGPAGENVEMERVASLLGRITADLTDAINKCMDAASEAESLKGEVDKARGSLDKIKAAVGPYRAA